MSKQNKEQDLEALRARLAGLNGQEYWRSLEELANTEAFQDLLQREFPEGVVEPGNPVSRRTFLKLMGASLALAGITSCSRQPDEQVIPYAQPPVEAPYAEQILPGIPTHYATAMTLGGFARGVLVESHMGHPTKVEGNPDHPASLGATDPYAQASILSLYDPDRSQVVLNQGQNSDWEQFIATLGPVIESQRANGGAGLRILTESVTSPTLTDQVQTFLSDFPQARWYQYEPIGRDNVRIGAVLAFDQYVDTIYHFDQADVVVALDADFLAPGPGMVRYAHDFAQKRHVTAEQSDMNRLYVVESTPSITGGVADNRLPLRASMVEHVARAIAAELGVGVQTAGELSEQATAWVAAVVNDLQNSQGASIVLAGEQQPPVVHALAAAINEQLGNVGEGMPVTYIEPVEASPDADQIAPDDPPFASLRNLVGEMEAGSVEVLLIMGGNPVYTAPVDIAFAEALTNVNLSVHLGIYANETAAVCTWHIPEAHYLESWSDARAYDGTVSIIQPLIQPLFQGKTPHELLAVVLENANRSSYDIVREYWQANQPGSGDFALFWTTVLNQGMIPGTEAPAVQVTAQTTAIPAPIDTTAEGMELVFRPDPTVWDGRFANNAWLQEMPKPITLLTWDNAALMSPQTAATLFNITFPPDPAGFVIDESDPVQVRGYFEALKDLDGRRVTLTLNDNNLSIPLMMVPGHAENAVTLYLGYGQQQAGQVGNNTGFDAYRLRPADAPWFAPGLNMTTGSGSYPLVTVQTHHNMEGRHQIRVGTLETFREDPEFVNHIGHTLSAEERLALSLYDRNMEGEIEPEWTYEENAWGMAIDLNACIGCGACVVACQAENNIPVVGKDQVAIGREMHWIRVDRYYEGPLENPRIYTQPVPCMHCERAPCEVVCPVNATVHDNQGINQMIYNRCVGTRYCSNNCPYKVRRFNFYQYVDRETPLLRLSRNPDVTTRTRGVMEKCTYCIQRINLARIDAKNENRAIRDGEIVPACAAACPTNAIVFGDTKDPNSRVSQVKAQSRNYQLLGELLLEPRTTYLARIINPHPDLITEFDMMEGGHGGGHGEEGGDHGEEDDAHEGGESDGEGGEH